MRMCMLGLGLGLGVLLWVGCGPAGASGRPTPETAARPTGSVRISLRVLLSPLGAHLSPQELSPIADFLERWAETPYAEMAENDTDRSTPAVMMAWIIESPDVHLTLCPLLSMMAEREGTGGDPGPALAIGGLAGMTHYLIRHPDANPDGAAVQVAGAEWGLRWYTASLQTGAATPNTFIDELVERAQRDGGLAAWYEERGIRCGNQR